MPTEPPCHVVSWARAQDRFPCQSKQGFWGTCATGEPPAPHHDLLWRGDHDGPLKVPDHDSAEWFEAVFVAAAKKWGKMEFLYVRERTEGPWNCEGVRGPFAFWAQTPHEALCAAVRGEPQP